MYGKDVLDHPPFQIHIEPDQPIELNDMLRCLGGINRQFEIFAAAEGLSSAKDAKLLVSSVKPGSIDIGLLPDLTTLGSLLAPAIVYTPQVLKFITSLKGLLDKFKKKPEAEGLTIRDCNDAINIARPTATSGGSQTFNTYQGDVYAPVFVLTAPESRAIVENATAAKALLEAPDSDTRQRVPMIWHGMDTDGARTAGRKNPDRATIEDIDPNHRPVFFEDDFAHLKREMIDDHDNPYKKIHFVDVKVSKIGGKVVSYRITGYHGAEDLPGANDN